MTQPITEQDKATNGVLEDIVAEIIKWQNRKLDLDGRCCPKERERGFQEGLRLGAAIVLARHYQEEAEEE